jgi:prevent-host-death family protein
MSGIPLAKAREEFSDLVNRAAYGQERIILSRQGKEVAALVSIDTLRALEEWERLEDESDMKAIEARRAEPSIPWEEVKASARGTKKKAKAA